MNIQQALEKYDSELGTWTLDWVSTGKVKTRRPMISAAVHELDEYPAEPKLPVWIVRPPNFEDSPCAINLGPLSKSIRVGKHVFLRGNGRSAAGRNALRHGRVNWKETMQINDDHYYKVFALSKEYWNAIDEIVKKWQYIQWFLMKPEVFERGNFWYAVARIKGGTIVVLKSTIYADLFSAYPQLFYSERDFLYAFGSILK